MHLTLGVTWDWHFAREFVNQVRSLPPFTVTVVNAPVKIGGETARRVQGVPAEARGPSDASRWINTDAEHIYHVQRG